MNVITQRTNRKKYLISSGWNKKTAQRFVRTTKKSGLFASTLNANQTHKIKMYARHRPITNQVIRKFKKIR